MKRRDFLGSAAASAGIAMTAGLVPSMSRSATTLPAWVNSLPLWQWYAIPNTALSSVAPSATPIGATGPSSKIEAWCGATLKRSGSVYMLGAAGGHQDYAGNEVNALQLNTASPAWVQLRAPTPNASVIDAAQFYLDNRPAATHTYYATQFVEAQNRMLVMPSPGLGGLGPAAPGGWPYGGSSRSFSFSVAGNDWDAPDFIARFPGGGDFTCCLCAKHPVTEEIYYSRNYGDGWYRFTPSANTWTKLSSTTRAPWYAGSAIDPNRNRILIVGGYDANGPEVRDLSGNSLGVSFGGQGAGAIAVNGAPGVVYDEANDAFLVLFNSGSSISMKRVSASSWNIDTPPITGNAPAARMNGIQNSVQYVPELGGIVIANSYRGNVYFMRTSGSGVSAPPPDTTPPPAPSGLVVS